MNRCKQAVLFVITLLILPGTLNAEPVDKVGDKARCSVCGMFVAKYDVWITQIRYDESNILSFDGVKDMMAYYFSPEQFGGPADLSGSKIYVKDY